MNTVIAAPGFMLLNKDLVPVSFNVAALQILAYPTKPERIPKPALFLKDKIRSKLLRPTVDGQSAFVKEYTSGRRKYRCRVFRFDCDFHREETAETALLLERHSFSAAGLSDALGQFDLTPRELETVTLLVEGLTSKQIAARMNISPNTVKAFLRLVMLKMDVSTRSGIVGKIVDPQSWLT